MSPAEFFRKLRAYPPAEWPWMAEAALFLGAARLLIRFVPFRVWRGWMGPIGARGPLPPLAGRQRASALRARRWIRRVSANAPFRAVCLPQAMAGRWMLARRGIPSELHIGARMPGKDEAAGRPFNLHAWLVCGDLCLTGAHERHRFAAFARPAAA